MQGVLALRLVRERLQRVPRGLDHGRRCTAPSDYSGVCSAAMDFSGFSTKKKAEIAAMCGYAFPCERKGASFLQKKKALSNKDLGAAIGSAIKEVGALSPAEVDAISPPVLVNPKVSAVINAANA